MDTETGKREREEMEGKLIRSENGGGERRTGSRIGRDLAGSKGDRRKRVIDERIQENKKGASQAQVDR